MTATVVGTATVDHFLIVVDWALESEVAAVQAVVQEHSPQWWHHFAEVWIVEGRSAAEWRDLVLPCLDPGVPSAVLVAALPAGAKLAYYGPDMPVRTAWLAERFPPD